VDAIAFTEKRSDSGSGRSIVNTAAAVKSAGIQSKGGMLKLSVIPIFVLEDASGGADYEMIWDA